MLRVLLVVATSLAATTLVEAPRAQKFETSPKGFMSTEGNTHFYLTAGIAVARRYMGIDNTNRTLMNIKSLAFRQDGGPTLVSTGAPDVLTASVHMGTTNFSVLHQDLDRNFAAGSRQAVFPRQSIKFPDWRTTLTSVPGPWNLVFPFKAPFLYLGASALVWDMTLAGGTPGSRLTDRYYRGYTPAGGSDLGAGCVSTGRSLPFHIHTQLDNSGSVMGANAMRLDVSAAWSPAGAQTMLSIAMQDSNATVPGFCHKIHALPTLTLPLGVAHVSGRHYYQFWSFPHNVSLVGQTIVTQAFAADPGQPSGIVLSNGTTAMIPGYTGTNSGVAAAYAFSDLVNAPSTGWLYPSGAYIARLEF